MKHEASKLILKIDSETKTEVLGVVESFFPEDNTYLVEWLDERGSTRQRLPEDHINIFSDFLTTYQDPWYETYKHRENEQSRKKATDT